MELKELYVQLAELVTAMQTFLDEHENEEGELSEEDATAYDKMDKRRVNLQETIARREKLAKVDAELRTPQGKPTGFLTTIATDATAYITTSGANPTADEIVNLIYSLPRPYRKNAAFLVNDSTLAVLRKFKDQNQRYLWEESYQAGEPSRFMGYPIYTSQYMPTVASGNFAIAFGDFSYYNIADRGERSFQELRELYITSGLVGFLMNERCDGILVDNSAIRAIKIK